MVRDSTNRKACRSKRAGLGSLDVDVGEEQPRALKVVRPLRGIALLRDVRDPLQLVAGLRDLRMRALYQN